MYICFQVNHYFMVGEIFDNVFTMEELNNMSAPDVFELNKTSRTYNLDF